jgi:hypothetical protein
VTIIADGVASNGFACARCAALAVLVAVPPAAPAEQPDDVREVLAALARTYRGHAKVARMAGELQASIIWESSADMAADRAKNPGTRRLGS